MLVTSCYPFIFMLPTNNTKLHKMVNKNTVKLRYSCMNNVQQIISSHVLTSAAENTCKLCNCREKNSCPVKQTIHDQFYCASLIAQYN